MIIQDNSQFYQFQISSATNIDSVSSLVLDLLNLLHSAYISDSNEKKGINLVNTVTSIIDKEYSDPNLSRQYIAEKCGKPLYAISRAFKNTTHLSYIDYLTNIRIKHAKEYLENTNLTLEEISAKVGYINLSSFMRTFKRKTGSTPSKYRTGSIK